MRVAQVVDGLRRGGAETLVVDLVEALAAAGVSSSAIVLGDEIDPGLHARLREAARDVRVVTHRPLSDPRLILDVRRAVRASAADVVHAHMVYAAVSTRLARLLGGVPRQLTTVHTAPAELAHGTRLRTQADLRTAWLSSCCVAPSATLASAYATACRPRPRQLEVVPNAARPRPVVRGREATRAALGTGPEELLVVAIARLDEGKGLRDLVDALPGGARLVVAGEGPDRGELERRLRARDLVPPDVLLGRREDVGDLLAAADVFCLPSHHEALPISVLEALHAGTAILATAVGALPDVLTSEEDALLVAPHDVAGLRAALERLRDDPALRARLAARGRAVAAGRHSTAAMAAAYATLYRALARRARPALPARPGRRPSGT